MAHYGCGANARRPALKHESMTKEFWATIAALIGVFIAIVGLMIALIADVRADMNAAYDLIYAELREIRNDQQEVNARVARIEGHLLGIEADDAPPAPPPGQ